MKAILINYMFRLVVWWLLPKLPTNWNDSEQVQVFFVALIRSTMANEFTKLARIPLDANTRLALATLAENSVLWSIAWKMLNSKEENDVIIRRETIRERVSNQIAEIRNRFAGIPESLLQNDGFEMDMDKLVTTLKAAKILFGGK